MAGWHLGSITAYVNDSSKGVNGFRWNIMRRQFIGQRSNLLLLNNTKRKAGVRYSLFTLSTGRWPDDTMYCMNGCQLPRETMCRDLGVLVTSDMSPFQRSLFYLR